MHCKHIVFRCIVEASVKIANLKNTHTQQVASPFVSQCKSTKKVFFRTIEVLGNLVLNVQCVRFGFIGRN